MIQMEVLWAPKYIFTLIFLPSIIPVQVTKYDIFLELSHLKEYRTEDHGAGGKGIGSPTTIHTNFTATSFRLLGIGLKLINIRYGMYSREERSRVNDAGEVTVGYLVIICNYITAITYRLLAMGLGRNPPPKAYDKTRVMQFRWKYLGLQSTFSL